MDISMARNNITRVFAIILSIMSWSASAFDFPQLPSLPKLPTLTPASSTGEPGKVPSATDWSKTLTQAGFCALLGGGAAMIAKNYAAQDAKREKLSSDEAKTREQGYMLGFGALGCAAGAAVSGTIYDKLSEEGRKNRENALREAAAQAREQSYTDPKNAALTGVAKPGPRYVENDGSECTVVEDRLESGEPTFTKLCHQANSSAWDPVVNPA
jgi:hypothetical protein